MSSVKDADRASIRGYCDIIIISILSSRGVALGLKQRGGITQLLERATKKPGAVQYNTIQLYCQVSIQLHEECFVVPSTLITHSLQS